jgi:hypothetical protein
MAYGMEYPDEHLEEDPCYVALTTEYDRLDRNDFKRGRLLRQMRDEKRFGPWGTFENCANTRLKITDRRARQLIDAIDIYELLEEHGCQPLPTCERQCRPLKYLKRDDLKVLAWTRACALKHGSAPDGPDVWREVRRLLGAVLSLFEMSRRDDAIVAWHEVPGRAPHQKIRPVGYGVILAGARTNRSRTSLALHGRHR